MDELEIIKKYLESWEAVQRATLGFTEDEAKAGRDITSEWRRPFALDEITQKITDLPCYEHYLDMGLLYEVISKGKLDKMIALMTEGRRRIKAGTIPPVEWIEFIFEPR